MKFFKKTDILVIIAILIIAMISWISYQFILDSHTPKAEIYYNSELIKTIDLKKGVDKRFSIPQADVVFHLYKDGKICFEESDCPDKVCIEAGKLSTPGQFAACIPNGVLLKIVSGDNKNNNDADIIVRN